jgi:hypothetical protein
LRAVLRRHTGNTDEQNEKRRQKPSQVIAPEIRQIETAV